MLEESPPKHVLVIHSEHLLSKGVARILQQQSDIEVVAKAVTDETMLLSEINSSQPHIVVIDKSLDFSNISALFGMLNECPDLRLIVVDENQNLIHIYDKRDLTITKVADLLDAVRKDTN